MLLQSFEIQGTVISLIEEMTADWDLELEEEISGEQQLIADLNFSSVDFVQLFVVIEEEFQKKLGFHDLLMRDGTYVDDLSVAQIAAFVQSKLASETVSQSTNLNLASTATTDQATINQNQVNQFRNRIPAPPLPSSTTGGKNKRAIFVLCPSRSGSTLLRVMLAGNKQLFAPPELHLLPFENLLQRKLAFSNDLNQHLLNGTVRALMELKGCTSTQAQQMMTQWEEQSLTTKEFYTLMQGELGERILVDKTPSYSYHADILKRAETDFEQPLYLHLLRHPYGMIRSFCDAKLDRLLPFMQGDDFKREQYAELAWLTCNQNISDFLHTVPPERQFKLKFEDLVTQTQTVVTDMCNFIGVDFQVEMLEPYKEKKQRMTDGVEAVSKMSGDLKFHLHRTIEPEMAYRWKQYHTVDFLGEVTKELAASFGYQI